MTHPGNYKPFAVSAHQRRKIVRATAQFRRWLDAAMADERADYQVELLGAVALAVEQRRDERMGVTT